MQIYITCRQLVKPLYLVINDVLVRLDSLTTLLANLTTYDDVGEQFSITHVIVKTMEDFNQLVDVVRSITLECDFPREYGLVLEADVKAKCDFLRATLNSSVNRYQAKFGQLELPFLSIEDGNDLRFLISQSTDFSAKLTGDIQFEMKTLSTNPELQSYNLGQYSNNAKPMWSHKSNYDNRPNIFIQTKNSTLLLSVSSETNQQSSSPEGMFITNIFEENSNNIAYGSDENSNNLQEKKQILDDSNRFENRNDEEFDDALIYFSSKADSQEFGEASSQFVGELDSDSTKANLLRDKVSTMLLLFFKYFLYCLLGSLVKTAVKALRVATLSIHKIFVLLNTKNNFFEYFSCIKYTAI
jgi:hypothetical protein